MRFNRFHATVAAFCAVAVSAARQPPASHTFLQKSRTFHSSADFARTTGGKVRLQRTLDPSLDARIRRVRVPLPFDDFSVLAEESPTVVWIGSHHGAVRLQLTAPQSPNRIPDAGLRIPDPGSRTPTPAVQYFAGQRWLPDDNVTGIGFDAQGAWIETAKGLAHVQYSPTTLADKSRLFVARVQARHNRWGLTATSNLRVPGDVSTNALVSTDNDGLWTAIYVAAECFRFKATGEEDARDNARRGMQAILRLEAITGGSGFPARSFIKVGQDPQPTDGEWHDTPDREWRWKGDTSSDEIVGQYFVYPIYYDLLATESERSDLSAAIERITNHILDHDYQLIDADGQSTRWGWWGPQRIWADPDETGLRALHILSHLRVAQHLARTPAARARYQAAYDDLVRTHKYHLLTRNQKVMVPGHINHSDDELAFLSYYPLLQYETDPALVAVYKQSLERSWQTERPERNPLWNVIYAAGTGAPEFDRAESLRTLQEIPVDTVTWTVTNSTRFDVPIDPLSDRFGHRQALVVLSYDELPMWKWNGNPYNLDGGNGGRSEDDGAYFLLPYWMGRYHRLWL